MQNENSPWRQDGEQRQRIESEKGKKNRKEASVLDYFVMVNRSPEFPESPSTRKEWLGKGPTNLLRFIAHRLWNNLFQV